MTNVVVIGGGVVGCTTAYRLARAGLTVTVVERGVCGREASWAGAGILVPGSEARDDPLAAMRRASVARYSELAAELAERSGVDPQYIVCGCLDLITTSLHMKLLTQKLHALRQRPVSPQSTLIRISVVPRLEQYIRIDGKRFCNRTE